MTGTLISYFLVGLVLVWVTLTLARRIKRSKFEHRIACYQFPPAISNKVRERYGHLTEQDVEQVIEALRDYFFICNTAGKRVVSMPSQVVDSAWHEFILFTRQYEDFCKLALGRFLHHTPAEAMTSPTTAQTGIKNAWRIACMRENIDPRAPRSLPGIFAIDAALDIPDGFTYALDCRQGTNRDGYCASHIGCGSGCSSGCSNDGCSGGGCGGD